jgi:hypothetical protein
VAGSSQPSTGDQLSVEATPPMNCRLNTCTRPRHPHAGGQGVHVGLRGGRDDRAGVTQDHVGQERGLERPRRRHHQHVLFQRHPQAMAPVRPPQEHRVLPGTSARCHHGTDGRIRAERRSAASLPHRRCSPKTVANPLPGCSRRRSRTCSPLCRHRHRCKQAEGWRLEQPEPGVLAWHTPGGRTCTTTPPGASAKPRRWPVVARLQDGLAGSSRVTLVRRCVGRRRQ